MSKSAAEKRAKWDLGRPSRRPIAGLVNPHLMGAVDSYSPQVPGRHDRMAARQSQQENPRSALTSVWLMRQTLPIREIDGRNTHFRRL